VLKGINKQVLEIHDTGSEYFEKALLFVNPEFAALGEESLREKFISAFSGAYVPATRQSRIKSTLRGVLFMLLSAGAGVLVTLLLR